MRMLERFLNFIIWCIHDIGRSIKQNPLTEAWRKMPEQEWAAVLRAPKNQSCKRVIKGTVPTPQEILDICKSQQRLNNPNIFKPKSIGEVCIQSAKRIERHEQRKACEKISSDIKTTLENQKNKPEGFKEHVRREQNIKKVYRFYTCYAPTALPSRQLQGLIVGTEDRPSGIKRGLLSGLMGFARR